MTVVLTKAERLARAVLLFHGADIWDEERSWTWRMLTGKAECTTKVLCDLAREVQAEEGRQ